jgi:hypothetical protein
MNNEFIPYELALELKQIGFNEPCLASYFHAGKKLDICEYINHGEYTVLAPLFQQAFRWFREKHGLCLVIKPIDDKKLALGYNLLKNGLIMNAHTTYEGAELACFKKLIEIAKGGNK